MTKKEECLKALQCLYLEVDSSIADDLKQKVLSALQESENSTASKKKKAPSFSADELWDYYSEHIDDDIGSLQMVAGTTVMLKDQFMKMFSEKVNL